MNRSPAQDALLRGAYDIHVHCGPDVIPRAQDLLELAEAASAAGMAGFLLKDHTSSTTGRAYTLNRLYPSGPRAFSALALNPPVGGLNPYAVEAALRSGVDVIFFPTYAASHQIAVREPDAFPVDYPRPGQGFAGISILDKSGRVRPEVAVVVDLIAAHDAVLATGHISPRESLALLRMAQERGVTRLLVTHASGVVPGMSIGEQVQAVSYGASLEHCLLAIAQAKDHLVAAERIRDQIRQVGVGHAILSSDLGQVPDGPIVQAFARCLGELCRAGMTEAEVRTMIAGNPRRLLAQRHPHVAGQLSLCDTGSIIAHRLSRH